MRAVGGLTTRRSPRACASCSRRWPFSAPAATRSRPRSPPCTTTRQAPRRPTGRRSLAWDDDLVAIADDPVRQDPAAVLGRAVAVGHVLGAATGLRETDRLRDVIGERHRWHAVRGHLHELGGDLPAAATAYAEAARRATNVGERDHLVRQAARARAAELCRNSRLAERPP